MGTRIAVRSKDLDGTVKKSWAAELFEQDGSLLVLRGVFEDEVSHSHLGIIQAGTISYEYYWLNRWYNVFRFHEPDGRFRNFYCNTNMPPVFDGNVLEYIDLDIDVLVDGAGRSLILDEDEFEQSREKFQYSAELLANAENALKELTGLIEHREFPFDYLNSLQQNS